MHHQAAIGLLVVTHAHHIDIDIEPEVAPRKGQGRSPLTCTRLGGEALYALLVVVVGLRNGAVGFV